MFLDYSWQKAVLSCKNRIKISFLSLNNVTKPPHDPHSLESSRNDLWPHEKTPSHRKFYCVTDLLSASVPFFGAATLSQFSPATSFWVLDCVANLALSVTARCRSRQNGFRVSPDYLKWIHKVSRRQIFSAKHAHSDLQTNKARCVVKSASKLKNNINSSLYHCWAY